MNEYFLQDIGISYRTNHFDPSRKTMVFVHGLSGSLSAWKNYEEMFAGTYNILTYDLRGHGKSIKYRSYDAYTIADHSSDLRALLLHLAISKCIVVCHSYATLIVQDFLQKYPGIVTEAVLLSPALRVDNQFLAHLIHPFLSAFRALDFPPYFGKSYDPTTAQRIGKRIDYARYIRTGDWNIPRMIADVGNTSLRVYLACTLHTYGVNYEKFFPQISIPLLLIHGKNDTVFPVGNSVAMSKMGQNVYLILIEKTDHILVLNNFPEVSEAIKNFIE